MESKEKLQRLEWLLEEVDSHLREATNALEKYLIDSSDDAQLSLCHKRIHQVCGSLEVADFSGPLQLAQEMERVVDSLLMGSISNVAETCQFMVGSFLQLSAYLAQLANTGSENPASLMLSMNDLLAIQHEPLVSLDSFFNPDIQAMLSPRSERKSLTPEAFSALVEKLRQMYQYALLRLIRQENFSQNLGYLKKAVSRLKLLSQGTPKEPIWRASSAVLEGLGEGCITLGPATSRLLSALDSEIIQLLEKGAVALDTPASETLLKELLFYVIMGNSEGKESTALRELCRVSKSTSIQIHSKAASSVLSDEQANKALSDSFSTELDQIKDYLERYVVEGETPELLTKALDKVNTLAASLDLVGVPNIQQATLQLADGLQTFISAPQGENVSASLMGIANQLVGIETSLYRHFSHHKSEGNLDQRDSAMVFDAASNTLLREARRSLERVKESIVDYIAAQWSVEKLQGIPELLLETIGAFQMLGQSKVALLLEGCEHFISKTLLSATDKNPPAWEKMDALADTITSIEYYIDFLDKHEPESAEQILSSVLEKMAVLEVSVKDVEVVTTVDELLNEMLEESTEAQQPESQPEEEDEVDEEIIEIFVEEATEVGQELRELYPAWVADSKNWAVLKDIRRAFHTLKGSGRMVGADVIGELAWSVESLLNKVIDKRVDNSATIMALVDLAIEQTSPLTKAFESRSLVTNPKYIDELIDTAGKLAKGEELVDLPSSQTAEIVEKDITPQQVVEAEVDAEQAEENTLLTIFSTEANIHLASLDDFVNGQKQDAPLYSFPPGAVQRALHTLKGSAKMAELDAIAELVTPLEHFVKELFHHQIDVDEDIVQLLDDAASYIRLALEAIGQRQPINLPKSNQFLARLNELKNRSLAEVYDQRVPSAKKKASPELLNALMEEGMQQVLDADDLLDAWLSGGDAEFVIGMIAELKNLSVAAGKAAIKPLVEVADLLQKSYSHIHSLELAAEVTMIEGFKAGHAQLLDMTDTVAASLDVQPLDQKIGQMLNAIVALKKPKRAKLDFTQRPISVLEEFDLADVDMDILEIFLVEADELSTEFDEALNAWQKDTQDAAPLERIKRVLHTLKGGARMAGLVQVGDISHELESDILKLEPQLTSLNEDVFNYLFLQQDALNKALSQIEQLRQNAQQSVTEVEEPIEEIEEAEDVLDEVAETTLVDVDASQNLADVPVIERKSGAQEMIRIAAPVLENLVNLAGESSISRGRIEQQISQFHGSLEEMEGTILRLQGQIRLLGIETEAQVTFRKEQIEASETVEGFDPLEMDRYSQLQQLSKSLLESSSDLMDFKSTLLNVARDSETQLLQQSRIQSDLQEALMRARMVSFSHIVPRLRRIVRQLGADFDKQVKLNFTNVDGEMDRSVLEKMVAPLEHMIRNAMDHGIEDAVKRTKAGKTAQGAITIGMERRGGEVIIRVADDGQGLNITAIKKKAIKQGLMTKGSELSDHEIAQFIFQAGFSTSEQVTQVSGRGVGMDVVFSQVRQLGGSIELENTAGQGLEFQIRLPFTVSVNRALMVRLRDDLYALPLNSIDGVVNISPKELENFYKHSENKLEYAGDQYGVRYLGGLLSDDLGAKIDFTQTNVSLVLVHSETGFYAVHVDALLTSQEVVVKSLGEQFSTVAGLSGATILNDGRVVVILDMLELLRTQRALSPAATMLIEDEAEEAHEDSTQTIMVVDDSVTVRKVTSRFLLREGFEVLTAKDGVEAIQLLQNSKPDLMLLDIEMPRMDGFEVAQRVKTTQRWKDIPIIMVTSRTGDKHRNRAMELGVNGYVGKPYQEDHLLESINHLLDMSVSVD